MAHSNPCCCWAVAKVSEFGYSPRRLASRWTWPSVTDDLMSIPHVWIPLWMYSDEMFYLYCKSCNAGFCLSALSWSLCWRRVCLSLLCGKDISRGGARKKTTRTVIQGSASIMSHVHSEKRWNGTRTNHTSTQSAGQWYPFSLSFPLCVVVRLILLHHYLSGQLRSLLRQHWNCLPALSALKCSLNSHPEYENLN